jgi:hypothetical protein
LDVACGWGLVLYAGLTCGSSLTTDGEPAMTVKSLLYMQLHLDSKLATTL